MQQGVFKSVASTVGLSEYGMNVPVLWDNLYIVKRCELAMRSGCFELVYKCD